MVSWETSPGDLDAGVVPPKGDLGECVWFAFRDDGLLVHETPPAHGGILPRGRRLEDVDGLAAGHPHYLGRRLGRHCFAAELAGDASPPEGMDLQGLRQLYGVFHESLFQLAGRAFQIVEWDRTHRYCGRCGAPTEPHDTERARRCPGCGLLSFPRVSPAVITLVHRGERFLLARNARFPAGRHSIIAGFVEPGETLEQAVAREIREEVSLEVTDIRYFGSQPWPFPHSLMVGFTAAWAGGDVRVDGEEIVEAGWYTAEEALADDGPALPDAVSISRRIIDAFIASVRG